MNKVQHFSVNLDIYQVQEVSNLEEANSKLKGIFKEITQTNAVNITLMDHLEVDSRKYYDQHLDTYQNTPRNFFVKKWDSFSALFGYGKLGMLKTYHTLKSKIDTHISRTSPRINYLIDAVRKSQQSDDNQRSTIKTYSEQETRNSSFIKSFKSFNDDDENLNLETDEIKNQITIDEKVQLKEVSLLRNYLTSSNSTNCFFSSINKVLSDGGRNFEVIPNLNEPRKIDIKLGEDNSILVEVVMHADLFIDGGLSDKDVLKSKMSFKVDIDDNSENRLRIDESTFNLEHIFKLD